MNDLMIEQIEQEFAAYKAEQERIGQVADAKNPFYVMGKDKTQLSKLSKYSKMLQMPVAMGNEKAAEVKGNIDNFLSQFDSGVSMKREVKPLSMQGYYQQTKEYSQFAR